jgi:hypothetical protein
VRADLTVPAGFSPYAASHSSHRSCSVTPLRLSPWCIRRSQAAHTRGEAPLADTASPPSGYRPVLPVKATHALVAQEHINLAQNVIDLAHGTPFGWHRAPGAQLSQENVSTSTNSASFRPNVTDDSDDRDRRFWPRPKFGHLQVESSVTFGPNDRSRSKRNQRSTSSGIRTMARASIKGVCADMLVGYRIERSGSGNWQAQLLLDHVKVTGARRVTCLTSQQKSTRRWGFTSSAPQTTQAGT